MNNLISLNQMIVLQYVLQLLTVTFVIIEVLYVFATRQVNVAILMMILTTTNER